MCRYVIYRWKEKEWERRGVIEKACESERKCVCGDKGGSLESGCSKVKKVSADVETRGTSRTVAVWEKLGERNGAYFQVCLG